MSRIDAAPGSSVWHGPTVPGPLARLEAHLARPGDTATRRFQKMLLVIVALVGSVSTVFNALQLFDGDLADMGWAYMASAVWLASGALIVFVRPSTYVPVTFLLLLDTLIFPSLVQVLSGGLTSGLYAMPWALFAPLGAALALGLRPAVVQLFLFFIAVVVVAALEPLAADIAPEISSEALLRFNVPSLLSLGIMAAATSLYFVRQIDRYRAQADSLLVNVLPEPIAIRLKTGEHPIADGHENVTVMFADIVDFTEMSSDADPTEVVGLLDGLFSDFDDIAESHGIEKIKTIGDAYMAAAGLTIPRPDHAEAIIAFALDLLAATQNRPGLSGEPIHLRIGVNTGSAVAGVIGRERLIYDLWGDTVNVASRMESNGLVDRILVTQAVVDQIGDRYRFDERPRIFIKGKGMTVTYALVTDLRPVLA